MKRRDFLQLAASAALITAVPRVNAGVNSNTSDWRTFELTYEVDLNRQDGAGRLWLPLPQQAGDYQRVLSTTWQGVSKASIYWDETYQSPIFIAEWDKSEVDRELAVTCRIATRDFRMASIKRQLLNIDDAALYLKPTEHMPVDGIVLETADKIVKGIKSPDEKARAIYEWIVDNTFRDPTIEGCGLGNIKFMLETGNLSGKCADINSLFVGLARAVGIPAREFYGVRVADSKQFKSLGKSGEISRAQHCRAEYFSVRYGWVPVDPADVRKVVLEEKLSLNDPRIIALRNRLFGYWEMNWVGFNNARDFTLPRQSGGPLPYLMYPYAEFGETRLNGRVPADFEFRMISRQLS